MGLRQEADDDQEEEANIIDFGEDIIVHHSLFFSVSASLGTSAAVPLPVTASVSSLLLSLSTS